MSRRKYKINTILSLFITVFLLVILPIAVIFDNFVPFEFIPDLRGTPIFRMGFVIAVCVIVGTISAKRVLKSTVDTILEMDQATKEIADGNYNIRIEPKSRLVELDDMAQNFNQMAMDLGSNALLRRDFISNVSHEFKTPLAAIEGYATLLSDPSLSPEQVAEYADSIVKNTRRLTGMTGNILLLSALENNHTPLKRQAFCLDEQIRTIILLFEKEWNEKQLTLDLDLPDTTYVGDADLLSHVWQNLVGNAVKFCPVGGVITMSIKGADSHLAVTCQNTGEGLTEEEQQRVFERFYQADRSHGGRGNGLGLSIAKTVVGLHDGTITVDSVPHRSTTFTVTLPYC